MTSTSVPVPTPPLDHKQPSQGLRLASLVQGLAAIILVSHAAGSSSGSRTCEIGLEEIVPKREGSFYWSGRSRNWLESQEPEFRQDVTAMHRDAISLGG